MTPLSSIVYRECDSLKINEMLAPKEGKYVEKITDEVFDKKVKKGYVLLDFGARWCGPCRLLAGCGLLYGYKPLKQFDQKDYDQMITSGLDQDFKICH